MSNTIQANPNHIDLRSDVREDVNMWRFPSGIEGNFDASENPAAQARAEYENGLYVKALASDQQSAAVNSGNTIDPAHAEAALSAARATVTDAYAATEHEQFVSQEAQQSRQEFILHAARLAGRLGDGLTIIRDNADVNWGARSEE